MVKLGEYDRYVGEQSRQIIEGLVSQGTHSQGDQKPSSLSHTCRYRGNSYHVTQEYIISFLYIYILYRYMSFTVIYNSFFNFIVLLGDLLVCMAQFSVFCIRCELSNTMLKLFLDAFRQPDRRHFLCFLFVPTIFQSRVIFHCFLHYLKTLITIRLCFVTARTFIKEKHLNCFQTNH